VLLVTFQFVISSVRWVIGIGIGKCSNRWSYPNECYLIRLICNFNNVRESINSLESKDLSVWSVSWRNRSSWHLTTWVSRVPNSKSDRSIWTLPVIQRNWEISLIDKTNIRVDSNLATNWRLGSSKSNSSGSSCFLK